MLQDVLCDLLEDHARRSWNSLKLTAGRKSLGKAKRASISFLLPSSYNVGCAIELLMRLMRKGLSCRVLNGEKVIAACTADLLICFVCAVLGGSCRWPTHR